MLRAMQAVLEELLLRSRLVDVTRARRAKEIANDTGCSLAHALVKLGFVSDRGLATLLSTALGLRVVDPATLDVDPRAIAALAGPVAYRLRALPVRLRTTAEGEFLYVAMSDPTDTAAVREIEATTGRELVPAVVEERALELALRRHYAAETLRPVDANPEPSMDELSEPPLVVGVLDLPATDPLAEGAVPDEALRAHLLSQEDRDDGEGFFTESTEELMTVYSRTLARAERGAEDKDLVWLAERQERANGETGYEDLRTAPLSVEQLARISAPKGAVPLPSSGPLSGEERTEPDLRPALAAARRELFRPPTCVVAEDLDLRSHLGEGLAGYLADLHVEPSVADALVLGSEVPLGYVVVVAPPAEPGVVRDIGRVSESAGAPRVVVVGGEAAFQVVPGVSAWIDLFAVGKARLCDEIVTTLQRLEDA